MDVERSRVLGTGYQFMRESEWTFPMNPPPLQGTTSNESAVAGTGSGSTGSPQATRSAVLTIRLEGRTAQPTPVLAGLRLPRWIRRRPAFCGTLADKSRPYHSIFGVTSAPKAFGAGYSDGFCSRPRWGRTSPCTMVHGQHSPAIPFEGPFDP